MTTAKLGTFFKRALLIEDSSEICDFYREFFEGENLPIDIMTELPDDEFNVSDRYDILICDWLVGRGSAKNWLTAINKGQRLPLVTIVATGMLSIEEELENMPIKVVYKPFDFFRLKEIMIDLTKNRLHPI